MILSYPLQPRYMYHVFLAETTLPNNVEFEYHTSSLMTSYSFACTFLFSLMSRTPIGDYPAIQEKDVYESRSYVNEVHIHMYPLFCLCRCGCEQTRKIAISTKRNVST